MLQIPSALISVRKDPSDQGRPHTLKRPAAVLNGSTGIKNALVKISSLSIGLEYAGVCKLPHRYKSKVLKLDERGGSTLNTVWEILRYKLCVPCFGMGNPTVKLVQAL